jgi:hypothetical protein
MIYSIVHAAQMNPFSSKWVQPGFCPVMSSKKYQDSLPQLPVKLGSKALFHMLIVLVH